MSFWRVCLVRPLLDLCPVKHRNIVLEIISKHSKRMTMFLEHLAIPFSLSTDVLPANELLPIGIGYLVIGDSL